jgi:predicted nucleic acid-binding Zn ribbon protein
MTPGLRRQVLHEWQPFFSNADTSGASSSANSTDKLVPAVMKKLGLEQRLQESQAFYLWPTIVGADIARHAQPVSLRNRLLVVAVDHPIWLQELSRYHKPLILQRVQERVGKKTIRDIVFRIG